MVVFKLGVVVELEKIKAEISYLEYEIEYEGYEDIGGYQNSQWFDYVEYVRFQDDNAAAQFVLTFGDKYKPRRTARFFVGVIRPLFPEITCSTTSTIHCK